MKVRSLLVTVLAVSLAMPAHAETPPAPAPTAVTEQSFTEQAAEKLQFWKTKAKVYINTWTSYLQQKVAEYTAEPARNPDSVATDSTVNSGAAKSAAASPTPSAMPAPASSTEEQKTFSNIIQDAKKEIHNKEAIREAKPGRVGTTSLPKTKVGVPKFSFSQTETKKGKDGKMKTVKIPISYIPRLDIGEERTISKNDFKIDDKIVPMKMPKAPQVLPTPSMVSQKKVDAVTKRQVPVIAKAKSPKMDGIEIGQIVTMKKIQAVPLEMLPTKPMEELKPYVQIEKDDETMLAAVILYEKGDKCHLVSGLLNDLANKPKYQEEANFYLGVCAHKMGFHSEAVTRLLNVVKINHKEFTTDAITNLVEDLPREYDNQVAPVLRNVSGSAEDKAKDNYYYILARASHEGLKYDDMMEYAAKVSEKSAHYKNARFIFAIGQYGSKNPKDAEASLRSLRDWLVKKGETDKNLNALIAVNLARIAFTQKRYEIANQEYLKVPKDHPLWVQALIEQGWTQLNIDDPEGAIGNMYSLHSPYFKFVYMPESWVVRTIGYISICQYGDAYRTLTRHEQLHSQWLAQMNKFMTLKKAPMDYYNTVKNYIKGQSDKGVDGLPPQVIREIARQKGFLNAQGALNDLEDEITQYSFIYGIVRKDNAEMAGKLRQTKDRLNKVKADLVKAEKQPELIKFVNEWKQQRRSEEQLVRYYTDMLELYEQARQGYNILRSKSIARIEKMKSGLRTEAGRELMGHLRDARANIEQMLEGNEFLRYEIFSGSGENIRYQVAGGVTENTKRIPSNIKPQKIMNWEFDGEFWEDEIGSYRSSLKNNCPKSQNTHSAQVNKDSESL